MRSILLSFALIASASACTSSGPVDELAGETDADQALDGKADASVDGTYTYYSVAATAAGTYSFARLNRTTTTCHDGSTSASCTTPELDWSESNLSPALQESLVGAASVGADEHRVNAIVRGRFAKKGTKGASTGRFIVTEAWTAQSGSVADGVFVKVRDGGVRCIAAPCESLVEKGLNTSRTAGIAGIDYTETGLDDVSTSALANDMYTAGGIIIAGERYTVHESGRSARGRTATAAFKRLVDRAFDGCVIGGCSAELCGEEAQFSPCIYRPEFACYQTATCERQESTGQCGWTPSGELDACLGN